MAKPPPETAEAAKTRKLRELREADEAARRAQGTWGTLAVGEISHAPTNSAFVMRCRGLTPPDPAKELRARSPLVLPDDYKLLVEWLGRRPISEYTGRLVAWNLSDQEAKRRCAARIEENRANGVTVINAAPASATPAAATPAESGVA